MASVKEQANHGEPPTTVAIGAPEPTASDKSVSPIASPPAANDMPIIVSSNRFNDLRPFIDRLFATEPLKWGQIFPWDFPQGASQEIEDAFLREQFGDTNVHMWGSRFLKQAWYSTAIWNFEVRVPCTADWWCKENKNVFEDANMVKWMLNEETQVGTFFMSNELAMFGHRFLHFVMLRLREMLQMKQRARTAEQESQETKNTLASTAGNMGQFQDEPKSSCYIDNAKSAQQLPEARDPHSTASKSGAKEVESKVEQQVEKRTVSDTKSDVPISAAPFSPFPGYIDPMPSARSVDQTPRLPYTKPQQEHGRGRGYRNHRGSFQQAYQQDHVQQQARGGRLPHTPSAQHAVPNQHQGVPAHAIHYSPAVPADRRVMSGPQPQSQHALGQAQFGQMMGPMIPQSYEEVIAIQGGYWPASAQQMAIYQQSLQQAGGPTHFASPNAFVPKFDDRGTGRLFDPNEFERDFRGNNFRGGHQRGSSNYRGGHNSYGGKCRGGRGSKGSFSKPKVMDEAFWRRPDYPGHGFNDRGGPNHRGDFSDRDSLTDRAAFHGNRGGRQSSENTSGWYSDSPQHRGNHHGKDVWQHSMPTPDENAPPRERQLNPGTMQPYAIPPGSGNANKPFEKSGQQPYIPSIAETDPSPRLLFEEYGVHENFVGSKRKDVTKVAVFNVPSSPSVEELRLLFSRFGTLNDSDSVTLAQNKSHFPDGTRILFLNFADSDAVRAILAVPPHELECRGISLNVKVAKQYWETGHLLYRSPEEVKYYNMPMSELAMKARRAEHIGEMRRSSSALQEPSFMRWSQQAGPQPVYMTREHAAKEDEAARAKHVARADQPRQAHVAKGGLGGSNDLHDSLPNGPSQLVMSTEGSTKLFPSKHGRGTVRGRKDTSGLGSAAPSVTGSSHSTPKKQRKMPAQRKQELVEREMSENASSSNATPATIGNVSQELLREHFQETISVENTKETIERDDGPVKETDTDKEPEELGNDYKLEPGQPHGKEAQKINDTATSADKSGVTQSAAVITHNKASVNYLARDQVSAEVRSRSGSIMRDQLAKGTEKRTRAISNVPSSSAAALPALKTEVPDENKRDTTPEVAMDPAEQTEVAASPEAVVDTPTTVQVPSGEVTQVPASATTEATKESAKANEEQDDSFHTASGTPEFNKDRSREQTTKSRVDSASDYIPESATDTLPDKPLESPTTFQDDKPKTQPTRAVSNGALKPAVPLLSTSPSRKNLTITTRSSKGKEPALTVTELEDVSLRTDSATSESILIPLLATSQAATSSALSVPPTPAFATAPTTPAFPDTATTSQSLPDSAPTPSSLAEQPKANPQVEDDAKLKKQKAAKGPAHTESWSPFAQKPQKKKDKKQKPKKGSMRAKPSQSTSRVTSGVSTPVPEECNKASTISDGVQSPNDVPLPSQQDEGRSKLLHGLGISSEDGIAEKPKDHDPGTDHSAAVTNREVSEQQKEVPVKSPVKSPFKPPSGLFGLLNKAFGGAQSSAKTKIASERSELTESKAANAVKMENDKEIVESVEDSDAETVITVQSPPSKGTSQDRSHEASAESFLGMDESSPPSLMELSPDVETPGGEDSILDSALLSDGTAAPPKKPKKKPKKRKRKPSAAVNLSDTPTMFVIEMDDDETDQDDKSSHTVGRTPEATPPASTSPATPGPSAYQKLQRLHSRTSSNVLTAPPLKMKTLKGKRRVASHTSVKVSESTDSTKSTEEDVTGEVSSGEDSQIATRRAMNKLRRTLKDQPQTFFLITPPKKKEEEVIDMNVTKQEPSPILSEHEVNQSRMRMEELEEAERHHRTHPKAMDGSRMQQAGESSLRQDPRTQVEERVERGTIANRINAFRFSFDSPPPSGLSYENRIRELNDDESEKTVMQAPSPDLRLKKVRGLGLQMPADPQSSVEEWRSQQMLEDKMARFKLSDEYKAGLGGTLQIVHGAEGKKILFAPHFGIARLLD